ncbi:hypothetical protein ACS0TY_016536 [Phlomoides rotata]
MILLLLLTAFLIFPAFLLFLFHKTLQPGPKPPLQYPPGPPGLPFIGNLHQFDNATPHIYLSQLSKKYGPLVSMKLGSVGLLVVSSPDGAKEVLKTHDLVFCSRPRALGQHKLSYNGSDFAFAPYNDSWRELRKICVLHLLSSKQVLSFRSIREAEVLRTMRELRVTATATAGEVVNLSRMMLSLTSTLICRMAFGKRLDEGGERRRRFDELMIECQAMLGGVFVSDYMPWFGWVDRVSGMIGRLDKVYKELDDFFEELIDEHVAMRGQSSGNPNILDLLIQLKEDKSCSIRLTWGHVKAILMDIFVAGTDTGAATVIWTMTALIKNPATMKKLQNEIRDSVGKKGEVNEEDLSKLAYLKAVIKEALRLHPPAPILLPRETLGVCNIKGYTIPPKTMVLVNAWAIARDPEYWESPNDFIPERFLDSNVDIIGQDFQVIPFGAGRRGCPAISMGLAIVELAVANLVYSFDWELPPGMSSTQDIDMESLPGIAMHKKNPLCLVPINTHLHL